MASMMLEAGVLLGPYEIVSLLGKGGMGEVYLGRDTRLGRSVAIKVIAASLSENPQFRERLRREAKTISQLQHPNVCTLHDVGEQAGMQYLVMEYLEGETLEQRLRKGPLPVGDALRIACEIADAIDAAHRSGIVHRDLKPGNVMLTTAGTKVLDFGLAKGIEAQSSELDASSLTTLPQAITREQTMAGTVPYMAPEQLEGKKADARTDIWALGCLLYEMVTGDRPFQGDSKASVITSIMSVEPEAMASKQPLGPTRLDWVVSRCLAKDPEKRWQSSRDVALELAAVGESVLDGRDGRDGGEGRGGSMPGGTASGRTSVLWQAGEAVRTRRRGALWFAAVLAVAAAAGFWSLEPKPAAAVVDPGAAVAVLPFENVTGNNQLGYVGLGLAAGLISQLSELPGVTVVGRSQAWSLRKKARSSAEFAERLGVSVLVEGEVHGAGQQLRVDVTTTNSQSAVVLWSGSFSGRQDDLYELQQRIARAVARVLSVSLSSADRRRLSRGGPSSQAFDFYLQGLERLEEWGNPRHLEFAADLFRQAIRIEGNVAVFHAALSTALWRRSLEAAASIDPLEVEREAREALVLDPALPEAHVALARSLRGRGRYAESIAKLRPLLARHPKPDEAFRELAFGYYLAGDTEASGECLETAVALGPENWFNWNALGVFQTAQGNLDSAKKSFEEALELAPDSVNLPRLNLGGVKLLAGDYVGAIDDFEATGATTSDPKLASNLGSAYFFQGRLDRAEALYRRAVDLDSRKHEYRRNLGDALLALGRGGQASAEFRAASELVEQALEQHPSSNGLLRARALYAAKTGDCDAAVAHAEAARRLLPTTWQNQLDLAMTFALCGRRSDALEAVKLCVEGGLPGSVLKDQPELGALLQDPEFIELTRDSSPDAA